jgi:RimJ/RimL family protein N-acetyltransferase
MEHVIKTNRLSLQPLSESDIDFIQKLSARPEYFRYECEVAKTNGELAERCKWYIERLIKLPDDGAIQWIVSNNDVKIGEIHIWCNWQKTHEWEIGWHLLHEHWGKGFATEAAKAVIRHAFENFNVNRIVAFPNAENSRSTALCERVGMINEGRIREVRLINGIYYDEYVYSILKRDFIQTK